METFSVLLCTIQNSLLINVQRSSELNLCSLFYTQTLHYKHWNQIWPQKQSEANDWWLKRKWSVNLLRSVMIYVYWPHLNNKLEAAASCSREPILDYSQHLRLSRYKLLRCGLLSTTSTKDLKKEFPFPRPKKNTFSQELAFLIRDVWDDSTKRYCCWSTLEILVVY